MLITLITYTKGAQKAHLMENPQTKELHVMHEDKNGFTQFPMITNGYAFDPRCEVLAYDYPERVSKGIVPMLIKAHHAKKMLEFARRNAGYHSISKHNRYDWGIAEDLQRAQRLTLWEATQQFISI